MKKPDTIDHDRLFKELLQEFFSEFIQAFFPHIYQEIDFSHLRFLQQELFTDITGGQKHVVDLLAETRLKDEESLILIHVENQAQYQPDFPQRMFIYYSRLYEKFRKNIIPIAVFSYDSPREEPDGLTLGLSFQKVLNFYYLTLELKKKKWRDFVRSENPAALALMSKMGFNPKERVRVKLEFLRMLLRLELNPAKMRLLTGFFESYLTLNAEEESEFNKEIEKLSPEEVKKVQEITTSWHEKGRKEGRREGKLEGKREGQSQLLMQLMEKRFSQIPSSWKEEILSFSEEKLAALGEAVLEAKSLMDLEQFFEDKK